MVKEKKEKNDQILEEIKRHNKVLMEHMEHQLKTVAEQYGSIAKKLEDHDAKFDIMEQRFDRFEVAVIANSRQIQELKTGQERMEKKLDTALDNHEKRIKKLEIKVGV